MISFSCPSCGRKFSVPDHFVGRQAQCGCKKMMLVPAKSEPSNAPLIPASSRSSQFPSPSASDSASASGSGAPMSMRQRRLTADEREMRAAFGTCLLARIVATHGNPVERYEIEFTVRSLVSGTASATRQGNVHRVEIQLTHDYPRVGPKCRMLTPIFHPNIDDTSICIGDHWTAGEKLSDLVIRIAEMLAYQAYNIRSPLNAVAAMWADLNGDQLPIDKRDLRAECEM